MARESTVLERYRERLSLLKAKRMAIDNEIQEVEEYIEKLDAEVRARLAPDVGGVPSGPGETAEHVRELKVLAVGGEPPHWDR